MYYETTKQRVGHCAARFIFDMMRQHSIIRCVVVCGVFSDATALQDAGALEAGLAAEAFHKRVRALAPPCLLGTRVRACARNDIGTKDA